MFLVRLKRRFRLQWLDYFLLFVLFLLITATYLSFSSTSVSETGSNDGSQMNQVPQDLVPDEEKPKNDGAGAALAQLLEQSRRRILHIPTILHHYFPDSGISTLQVKAVHSWASHNKNYSVTYWNQLYVEKHLLTLPQYKFYSNFYFKQTKTAYEKHLINKLIILYHHGGVLVDISMHCLGDISEYLKNAKCVISTERTEKAILMYNLETLPTLSVLSCVKQHFFLKYFLEKTTKPHLRTGAVTLNINTVQFIVHVVNAAFTSFDDDCANRKCPYEDRMTVAEPSVFNPLIDEPLYENFLGTCANKKKLEWLAREACYNLEANKNTLKTDSLSYQIYIHLWQPNIYKPLILLKKIPKGHHDGERVIKNFEFLLPTKKSKLKRTNSTLKTYNSTKISLKTETLAHDRQAKKVVTFSHSAVKKRRQ